MRCDEMRVELGTPHPACRPTRAWSSPDPELRLHLHLHLHLHVHLHLNLQLQLLLHVAG